MLTHLESGGGFGFLCFRPAVVKRSQYLWREYRFGGRLCNSVSTLQDLIGYLERLHILSKAWWEWADHCTLPAGSFQHQVSQLEENDSILKAVLELRALALQAESFLASNGIATTELVGAGWATALLDDIEAASAIGCTNGAKAELERTIAPIAGLQNLTNPHPLTLDVLNAVRSLDPVGYHAAIQALQAILAQRTNAARCQELDQRLRSGSPQLADALKNPDTRDAASQHLPVFESAWAWKKARQWLERFGGEATPEEVATQIGRVENEVATLTQNLVALRAWQSCYEDLHEDYEKQAALQAWQQAMRRIGRGTGKYTETHRRDARKYLERCCAAIPAWIMPLHRVAETIDIQAGAFDIVIVDEASQTGPEGLILQFLGKQCIIVGDDKQISPEAVGVNQNAVRAPHGTAPQWLSLRRDPQSSVKPIRPGDSALRGNRVTLQEHFRCMPEIIRFLNDLCYQDTPLIPLRQYPPTRLEPIIVRHVVDGYREGADDRVVNRPEAAALVKAIIDCLDDPQYAGKSMGVICLQGHAQAQLIEHMLLDAVGPAPFEQRQLICGDPYSFQGDERDVMFLSLVAASEGDRRMGALVRESYRQRFNVAVSRARDQLWVFHSVQQEDLHPECMRRHLLEYCYNPKTQTLSQDLAVCDSEFERDVARELIARNYRVVPQYPSAGKKIDLVIEGTAARLAVECDGDRWHGPDRYEADMRGSESLNAAVGSS